jgi:hypothetical protein
VSSTQEVRQGLVRHLLLDNAAFQEEVHDGDREQDDHPEDEPAEAPRELDVTYRLRNAPINSGNGAPDLARTFGAGGGCSLPLTAANHMAGNVRAEVGKHGVFQPPLPVEHPEKEAR